MSVSLSTLFRYAAQNECVPVFEATYMCLLEFPWPLAIFFKVAIGHYIDSRLLWFRLVTMLRDTLWK